MVRPFVFQPKTICATIGKMNANKLFDHSQNGLTCDAPFG
ncbi:hypothetical protein [Azospirillum doebereinerae]